MQRYTVEFSGHRAHSMFTGYHVPNQKRHRRHHRRSHKNKNGSPDECERSGKIRNIKI